MGAHSSKLSFGTAYVFYLRRVLTDVLLLEVAPVELSRGEACAVGRPPLQPYVNDDRPYAVSPF